MTVSKNRRSAVGAIAAATGLALAPRVPFAQSGGEDIVIGGSTR